MKSKKFIIIFFVVTALLFAAMIVVAVIKSDKNLPDEPVVTDNNSAETTSIFVIPELEPETTFPEEYLLLVDSNLLNEMERLTNGVPAVDEDGNYYTAEDGELVYDASSVADYTNMKQNLAVLVYTFIEKGYSDNALQQIQRLYYYCYKSLSRYDYDELIDKISQCIPADGTNADDLTENAKEVFGMNREDGFSFVFETVSTAEISVHICDVKPYGQTELDERQEALCIYAQWHNPDDDGYERNIKEWLHRVISAFTVAGFGEKDIVTAQLLFVGSLAESDYRPDFTDIMINCFYPAGDTDYDYLKMTVMSEFGVSIDDNSALCDYLDGMTVYGTGE